MSPPRFSPQERRQARRLVVVIALVGAFFVVELGGALIAQSVVLQADALHLLMDVLALGMSLLAMRLAVRKPTPRFTYGLRRAEPVAAIFSATLVLVTTALIVVEGVEALGGHTPPKAGVMLVVAVLAIVVNGLSAWLLHDVVGHGHQHGSSHAYGHEHDSAPGHEHDGSHGHDHDHDGSHGRDHEHDSAHPPAAVAPARKAHGHALNLRGAWLHLAGDALGAVAALVAALVIHFGGPASADPIASFAVAAILVLGAVVLLRDAALVLLEASPVHLPVAVVRQIVVGFPEVTAVHELHVWTLGAGHDAVTVHVETASLDPAFGQRLSDRLRETLGAEYVTVQTVQVMQRAQSVQTPPAAGADRSGAKREAT
jgi:cation diffusion facilitator family transporter